MITREKTDLYLNQFNYLTEALCLSWHKSFSEIINYIDEEVLSFEIRSYGFYTFNRLPRKDILIQFKSKLFFKNLEWANQFADRINDDRLCDITEPYQEALREIESNLFLLKSRDERVAFANLILSELDKTHNYNQNLDHTERASRYKKMFYYVLSHNFIAEDNVTSNNPYKKLHPIFKLQVLLIHHLDFTDRLMELFKCFDIHLQDLNYKSHCILYLFDKKHETSAQFIENNIKLTPKFHSCLSDECLIRIMLFLESEKWLTKPDSDDWLYWFNRKSVINTKHLVWSGTPTMLSNIIQHICNSCQANTIKFVFETSDYVRPTRSDYKKGTTYKKIEQLITLFNKKSVRNSD